MIDRYLSPKDAALLAQMVYGGLSADDPKEIIARYKNGDELKGKVTPLGGPIKGRSGAVIKPESNFAMVLAGIGDYQGDAIVAIRGTDLKRDWLTNFNVSTDTGPGGYPVHSGFNRVYRSLIRSVKTDLSRHPAGRVHIVGHSLGGGVATNVALDLRISGRDVALYTFGAPRAGLEPSARQLTTLLKKKNLKRVYNISDPVPMIPVFPFMHAPMPDDGLRIGKRTDIVWKSHHSMNKYIDFMRKQADWDSLAEAGEGVVGRFETIESALQAAARWTRIPGASYGLHLLTKALGLIVKAAGGTAMMGVSGAVTALDMISSLLIHAVEMAGKLGSWVVSWVGHALRWLGREVATTAADITRAFLRYVLNLFFSRIAGLARRALEIPIET